MLLRGRSCTFGLPVAIANANRNDSTVRKRAGQFTGVGFAAAILGSKLVRALHLSPPRKIRGVPNRTALDFLFPTSLSLGEALERPPQSFGTGTVPRICICAARSARPAKGVATAERRPPGKFQRRASCIAGIRDRCVAATAHSWPLLGTTSLLNGGSPGKSENRSDAGSGRHHRPPERPLPAGLFPRPDHALGCRGSG